MSDHRSLKKTTHHAWVSNAGMKKLISLITFPGKFLVF